MRTFPASGGWKPRSYPGKQGSDLLGKPTLPAYTAPCWAHCPDHPLLPGSTAGCLALAGYSLWVECQAGLHSRSQALLLPGLTEDGDVNSSLGCHEQRGLPSSGPGT
jgi:hypothetical protein